MNPGNPTRVVIDTNLVLSALVFGGGTPAALRQAWQAGRCRHLVSKETAAELIRVLAYPKFRLFPAEREDLLADYLPYCTSVRVPAKVSGVPECRDPFDLPFLRLALAGKADFLVTGDDDLLSLAAQFPCAIVTAADVLTRLPAKGP